MNRSDSLIHKKPIYGLVLAGGRSLRMNTYPQRNHDPVCKAQILIDGTPQWARSINKLKAFCQRVFLSCRKDQMGLFNTQKDRLGQTQIFWDDDVSRGPATGIFQAFSPRWPVDWFVMAVDLPGLEPSDVQNLVDFHLTRHDYGATAFAAYQESASGHFSVPMPEPLCSIWTRRAQEVFLQHYQRGLFSSLAVLHEVGCKILDPKAPESLKNANYPEDWVGYL